VGRGDTVADVVSSDADWSCNSGGWESGETGGRGKEGRWVVGGDGGAAAFSKLKNNASVSLASIRADSGSQLGST
jgi:hypothetical protein